MNRASPIFDQFFSGQLRTLLVFSLMSSPFPPALFVGPCFDPQEESTFEVWCRSPSVHLFYPPPPTSFHSRDISIRGSPDLSFYPLGQWLRRSLKPNYFNGVLYTSRTISGWHLAIRSHLHSVIASSTLYFFFFQGGLDLNGAPFPREKNK